MLQRIVEIAEEGRSLILSRGFVVIKRKHEELGRVPLTDVSILMISARSGFISKPLLSKLAEKGAITIFCDSNYNPVFMGLPEAFTEEAAQRIKAQIAMSVPLKKKLWKSIVQEKLKNQAKVLELSGNEERAQKIFLLAKSVQSGDKGNREAWGARLYWSTLFGNGFKRDKNGEGLNAMLNYGYAIIRSACARSISCVGLLPMFSIMHQNRRDYFALADDIMEPLRPMVDWEVKKLSQYTKSDLTPEVKHKISKIIWYDVESKKGVTPLINAIHDSALSLVDSFLEKKNLLSFPNIFINQNYVPEQI